MEGLPKVPEEPESVPVSKSPSRKRWMKKLSEKYGDDWSVSSATDDDVSRGSLRISDVDGHHITESRMKSDSVSTDYSAPRTNSMSLSLASEEGCGHRDYSIEVLGTEDATGLEIIEGEDDGGFTVEVLGGEEPPEEWKSLSEHKPSISEGSTDLNCQEENELANKDSWNLGERDDDSLEADMKRATDQLTEVGLASDEDSLTRSPTASFMRPSDFGDQDITKQEVASSRDEKKKISSPTTFPSNFSSVRSSKATERFAERMKSIEKLNTAKTKSRMVPVVAAIGKFSSTFRKFQSHEEQSSILESSAQSVQGGHSFSTGITRASSSTETNDRRQKRTDSVEAQSSTSYASNQRVTSPLSPTHKKLPRIPYPQFSDSEFPAQQEERYKSNLSSDRGSRPAVSTNSSATVQKHKIDQILDEEEEMRSCTAGTANTPDVVPAAAHHQSSTPPVLQFSKTENEMGPAIKFDMPSRGDAENPHFDIDIVIKRDPLPDDTAVNLDDYYSELPTAAITLGRDQVKVMKVDSSKLAAQRALSPCSNEEILTVWDTEVPVRDPHEKAIPATKLHVTQLVRGLPNHNRSESSPQRNPAKVIVGQVPSLQGTRHAPMQDKVSNKRTDHEQEKIVSIRPDHSIRSAYDSLHQKVRRARSSEDILSPKMRTSLALDPAQPNVLDSGPAHPTVPTTSPTRRGRAIKANERAIPLRRDQRGVLRDGTANSRVPHEEPVITRHAATSQRSAPRMSSSVSHNPSERTVGNRSPVRHPAQPTAGRSSSLDDLTQTGLVADVKNVFSPKKDPNKQYFGTWNDNSTTSNRHSHQRVEGTRESRAANTRTSRMEASRSVTVDDSDKQWFMRRTPSPKKSNSVATDVSPKRGTAPPLKSNLHRRPQGRRSKSLGRTPSSTIAKMANFFKEEAEQGASHRVVRIMSEEEEEEEIHSVDEFIPQQHVPKQFSEPQTLSTRDFGNTSRSIQPQRRISVPSHRTNRDMSTHHRQRDSPRDDSEPSERPASIGQFIDMYNEIDSTSRFADQQKYLNSDRESNVTSPVLSQPRREISVKEHRRSYDVRDEKEEFEEEQPNDRNQIDDRPLAASAFKAWQRTDDQHTSSLEQKLEHGYQRHVVAADQKWGGSKIRHHSHPDKSKNMPWWKQQNQMLAESRRHRERSPPAREGDAPIIRQHAARTESSFQQSRVVQDRIDIRSVAKPPRESPARETPPRGFPSSPSPPRELPPRRSQVPGDHISPYANYQLQYDDTITEQTITPKSEERREDHYAQIRKIPNPRQQDMGTSDQQPQQQLHVNVASPPQKPQRYYGDDKTLREHQNVVDNRTYYDPYTNAPEMVEPHVQQQPVRYDDRRYASADWLDSPPPMRGNSNYPQHIDPASMTHHQERSRYEYDPRNQSNLSYGSYQGNHETRSGPDYRYPQQTTMHPMPPSPDYHGYRDQPGHGYPSTSHRPQIGYPNDSYRHQPSSQNYPNQPYRPQPGDYPSDYYSRQPPTEYSNRQQQSYPNHATDNYRPHTISGHRPMSFPDSRGQPIGGYPNDRNPRPIGNRNQWRSATVDRHIGMRNQRHMPYNMRTAASSDGIDRVDYHNHRSNSLRHPTPQRYTQPRGLYNPGDQRHPDPQRTQPRTDSGQPSRNTRSQKHNANRENEHSKNKGQRHGNSNRSKQQQKSNQKSTAKHDKTEKQLGKSKGKPLKQNNDNPRESIEEPKAPAPTSFALPDFIPIQHVNPPPPQQQYNDMAYKPHAQPDSRAHESQSPNPYMNRARPGVSVMFNPRVGATDF